MKVLWDIDAQSDNMIEAKRPDIIVVDKKGWMEIIIDIVVSADVRVGKKEEKSGEVPGLEERLEDCVNSKW